MASLPFVPVLLAAFGSQADRLSPEARAYVAGAGIDGAGRVRVSGTFAEAGARRPWLMGFARPFLGPGLLITRFEPDVDFDVVNTHTVDVSGHVTLAAERTMIFRGGAQSFRDTMMLGPRPGTVLDRLGDKGRIEILLDCLVTDDGGFRLRSRGTRLRIGGRGRWADRGLSLPGRWGVDVLVDHGYDELAGRHTITATSALPLIGMLVEYRGRFEHGE